MIYLKSVLLVSALSLAVAGLVYWQGRKDESVKSEIKQYKADKNAQTIKESIPMPDSTFVYDSLLNGGF